MTTYYVGNHFEWTGSTSSMIKYYYAGGQRVAMRVGSNAPLYLSGDHLGSTSLTMNSDGTLNTTQRYYPWGSTRAGSSPTAYQFTGQRNDSAIGLYFYNARYYDSALGRFIQADTIVPSPANPQTLNRYAYTLNNPLKYTDPSGHIHFLVTAAIGGLAGAAFSIGTQMLGAWQSSGRAISVDEAWQSVNWSEVAVATVGGAVAGGTMGAVSPAVMAKVIPGVALKFGEASLVTHLTGLGISVGAGGLSGIAGGQAEALTEGVIAEGVNSRTGDGIWDFRGAWNEARNSGLCDMNTIQKDALVGGIAGGIGYEIGAIKSAIGLAPQPQWRMQVHPDRINYARKLLSPQLRRYLLSMEMIDQFAGEEIENILQEDLDPLYP